MNRPKRPKYRFPWRAHNRFILLVDSPQFYPRMLAAIDQAKYWIALEQYLVVSGRVLDRFIEAILRARKRGVTVFMLLDDYGSQGVLARDRARLREAGVHLEFYNPFRWSELYRSLFRDHRKLLLVDGERAYVGGAGLLDVYDAATHEVGHWHDVMIEAEGEVCQDWYISFYALWEKLDAEPLPMPPLPVATGHDWGRVVVARGPFRNEITRAVIARAKRARQRIWLSTPYFIATRRLRRHLRRAARKGVDVRLLLPGPHTDHPWLRFAARHYYYRLLRDGVRIFEFQPRFVHAKMVLCDDWVSIGSSNLDRWNQRWNLDANQIVVHADTTQTVQALFEQDFVQCEEILPEHWQRRHWYQHLAEWISIHLVNLIQLVERRLPRRGP